MLNAEQTPRLGSIMKTLAATIFATFVALALGYSATAAADPPACPKNTVTIDNQGQVIKPPQQSQVCDDDPTGGLLGDLPVLGNLPGVGGIL
jgi:hypothetical protein